MFLYFARHPESKTSQGIIFPKRTIFPKDLPLVLEVLNLNHKPTITFLGLNDIKDIKIELTWSQDRNVSSSNKESKDEIKCPEINEKERDTSTTHDSNHPVGKTKIYKLTLSKGESKPNGKQLMQSSIFTRRQFDKEKVRNEENTCKPEVNACTCADDAFVFGNENEELDWEEELEKEDEEEEVKGEEEEYEEEDKQESEQEYKQEGEQVNEQEGEQVYEKEGEQEYEQEGEQVYEQEGEQVYVQEDKQEYEQEGEQVYEQVYEQEDKQECEQEGEQVYEQEDKQEYEQEGEQEDEQEDKQEYEWGYEWEYEQEYDFEDEQEYEQGDEQQDEKEEEPAEKQTNRLFCNSSNKKRGARFPPKGVPPNQIVTRYNCAESPIVSNWMEYFRFYGTKVMCYDGEMIFQLCRIDKNPEDDFVAYIVRNSTPLFPAERKAVLISEPAHRLHDPRVWCYYKWIYNTVTNSEAQERTPNGISFYDLKSNLATYEQWVITAFTNFKENEEVEVEEELEEEKLEEVEKWEAREEKPADLQNRPFCDSSTKQKETRFPLQDVPLNQLVTRYNCAENPIVSNWMEYFRLYGTKVMCYDGEMIFQLCRKDKNPEDEFLAYIVRDCTPLFPAERKAVLISEPAHRLHDPRVWCYYKWIYNTVTNNEAQELTPNGISFYDLKTKLEIYEKWVITAFTNTNY